MNGTVNTNRRATDKLKLYFLEHVRMYTHVGHNAVQSSAAAAFIYSLTWYLYQDWKEHGYVSLVRMVKVSTRIPEKSTRGFQQFVFWGWSLGCLGLGVFWVVGVARLREAFPSTDISFVSWQLSYFKWNVMPAGRVSNITPCRHKQHDQRLLLWLPPQIANFFHPLSCTFVCSFLFPLSLLAPNNN